MSKIDELIQQYCPDGVEYVRLSDLCIKVCSGGTPSRGKSEYFTGEIPWLRTQEVDWKDIYDTEIKITEDAVNNSSAKLIPENCVIVAMYGATAGKVGINKIPLTTNQACCNLQIDSQKALYRYVYHWICHEYENIKALGQGSQNNINAQIVKDYPIPLPPLPIQEEIVRILDTFSELQAELQAELLARKQQYQYYREKLFAFKEVTEVENKSLEELGKNLDKKRKPITAAKRESGNTPYYGASGIVDYVKGYIFEGDYLLISEDGANLLTRTYPIAFSIHGKTWVNNHAHVIEFKESVTRKYVEYYLNSIDLSPWISAGAQPKLTQDNLNRITIPIPSFAEQQRIVSILDKFDTLVNDHSLGLPAEIEARKQQYEYYRDKLLTFKRKGA